VVNASPSVLFSSAGLYPPSSELGSPLLVRRAVLSREVKMLAIATAALIVLSATAQAATKYNYGHRGSYEPSYEHRVYGREYKYDNGHEAYKTNDYSYERHYDDQDYKPSYKRRYAGQAYREPHHGSYDEDHYGRDAYSEEPIYDPRKSRPTYKQSHELQSYRLKKRSAREGQVFGHGLGFGQLKRIGNSDAKVQIHIFTGQAQDESLKEARIVDANSASQSDADSEDSNSGAQPIENTEIIDVDFV